MKTPSRVLILLFPVLKFPEKSILCLLPFSVINKNMIHNTLFPFTAIHIDGVNLFGYCQWTLIDNFEWGQGYLPKFGIHYVDFEDPERTRYEKRSAQWYDDHDMLTKLARKL